MTQEEMQRVTSVAYESKEEQVFWRLALLIAEYDCYYVRERKNSGLKLK